MESVNKEQDTSDILIHTVGSNARLNNPNSVWRKSAIVIALDGSFMCVAFIAVLRTSGKQRYSTVHISDMGCDGV